MLPIQVEVGKKPQKLISLSYKLKEVKTTFVHFLNNKYLKQYMANFSQTTLTKTKSFKETKEVPLVLQNLGSFLPWRLLDEKSGKNLSLFRNASKLDHLGTPQFFDEKT